jgi:hypothetical protein
VGSALLKYWDSSDKALLTRAINTKSVAAIWKYFAPKLCYRCFGEALSPAYFLHELDCDAIKKL